MSGRESTRRRFLAGAAGVVGGGIIAATARDLFAGPAAAAPQPTINPRSSWGADLMPKGPLPAERPEDVKFLLVHHTAGANGYPPDAVRSILRGIFSYHTGPKGWNDVAYNFFVDAHGGIWEGRQGSLTTPVKGDATGGSQGFAQLCCFMGDHQTTPPTAAALASMSGVLAWLAGVYHLDLRPGATTTFVSRGSNLHPAGKRVTTPTIAAHRDMSKTTCPGDACYPLVKGQISQAAAAKAVDTAATAAPILPTPPADPSTTIAAPAGPAADQSTLPAASPPQIGEDNPASPETSAAPAVPADGAARTGRGDSSSTARLVGVGGVGAVTALAGAAIVARRRRARTNAEARWYSSDLLNPPTPEPLAPPGPVPDLSDGRG